MFKIKLTAKAKRELRNLSKLDRLQVGEIIEDLKEDPLMGKPLSRELIRKFSYRVGIYRVIYLFNQEDQLVIILSAGHRGKVYN